MLDIGKFAKIVALDPLFTQWALWRQPSQWKICTVIIFLPESLTKKNI